MDKALSLVPSTEVRGKIALLVTMACACNSQGEGVEARKSHVELDRATTSFRPAWEYARPCLKNETGLEGQLCSSEDLFLQRT